MTIEFQKKRGFTLIEVLVVIAIIAMLMSILVPSLNKAREQSRQVVCGTNLHAIGQGIVLYAHNNDDLLVPGDYSVPWIVWTNMQEQSQQVNLGYLMTSEALPLPESEKSVFFCTSMKSSVTRETSGEVYFDYGTFQKCWGQSRFPAPVGYMFNTSLDGFGNSVGTGTWPILSHRTRVQYLLTDGSVHSFKVEPLLYDASVGPELIQDVCRRKGVNFPSQMLHQWLAKGQVNLDEAKAYLADPAGWMNMNANSTTEETANHVRLAQVSNNTSIVCDVIGTWDSQGCVPIKPG